MAHQETESDDVKLDCGYTQLRTEIQSQIATYCFIGLEPSAVAHLRIL